MLHAAEFSTVVRLCRESNSEAGPHRPARDAAPHEGDSQDALCAGDIFHAAADGVKLVNRDALVQAMSGAPLLQRARCG